MDDIWRLRFLSPASLVYSLMILWIASEVKTGGLSESPASSISLRIK